MKQSYRRQYPNMRFYPDDDLARLADKADRQRAKKLDRLVNQKAEALEHRQYPGKRFSQIFKKVFGGR